MIHPSCNIPTLFVNVNYTSFQLYCSFVSTISPQSTTALIASPSLSTITTSTLEFLDRSIFVTQDVDGDPTDNDDLSYPIFEVGQQLHLMLDGQCLPVKLISVNVDHSTRVSYWIVRYSDGTSHRVVKEHLSPIEDNDLINLPHSSSDLMARLR